MNQKENYQLIQMLQKQIFVVSPVRRFLKSMTEVESLMLLGSRFQRRLPVYTLERVPMSQCLKRGSIS